MMKRPSLFIAGGILALCLWAGHARADSDSDNRVLLNRVVELESEVKSLSQKTYSGQGYTPGDVITSSSSNGNAPTPDFETRLSALETQIRNLTGQVEQSNYQTQQSNLALQKLSGDMDFRLQQLEQRQAYAAPVVGTMPMAPAPVASTDPNAPITNMGTPMTGAMIANAAPPPTAAINENAPATPEELYNRAYSEMQRKEYGTAQADFKTFLASNPSSKLAPNAQYWLGEIYYAQGNYKLASATFADGYQKSPQGNKAPDNLLKLGLSLEQQNRTKDACTVLKQLVKDYPSAPDTTTASATRGIKRMQCSSKLAAQ